MLYVNLLNLALFFFYQRTESRLLPLPDEFHPRLSLAKCISKVTDSFPEGEILLVSLAIEEVDKSRASAIVLDRLLFYELYKSSGISIIIRKTNVEAHDATYEKKIDNYLILIRKPEEILDNINVLNNSLSWNPHAKFIVSSATTFKNPVQIASTIIKELWMNRVVNGVVLLKNTKNSYVYTAYSWWPFNNGKCGDAFETVQELDSCTFGNMTHIDKDWFPDKIPNNLNGCPIKVRTVVWPPYVLPPQNDEFTNGREILLVETLAKTTNFTPIYSTSSKIQDWGTIYKNGTATGSMAALLNGEVDLTIGAFAATEERHKLLDSINYSLLESIIWCVPHGTDIPQFRKFISIIKTNVWIALICVYFLVGCTMKFLSNFKLHETKVYKSVPNSLQIMLGLLVTNPARKPPKTNTLRYIFIAWVFFSLQISFLYQTFLISHLTKPKYEQKIKNFQDITDYKLKTWFLPNSKRYFADQSDPLSRKILEKWQLCKDIYLCLQKVAVQRDSAMCGTRRFMKYSLNYYVTKKREPLIYCFPDSLLTYPTVMYLQPGFPLTRRLSLLIGRVTSGGLDTFWEKNLFEEQTLEFKIEAKVDSHENDHKITFKNLKSLFIALIAAYFIATVVLCLEIYFYKLGKK